MARHGFRMIFAVCLPAFAGCEVPPPATAASPSEPPPPWISAPVDECAGPVPLALADDRLPAGLPTRLPDAPRALVAPAPPAWTNGRALAVHGEQLFALDADNGDLVVLDRHALQVVRRVPVGQRPEQVVVGPDGTAFVSVRHGGAVVRVPPGHEQGETWPVGVEPWGLALSAAGDVLFVTLGGEGAVVALDPQDGKLLGRAAVLAQPRGIACSSAGFLAVAHAAAEAVLIDLAPVAGLGRQADPGATVPGLATRPVALRRLNPAHGQGLETGPGALVAAHAAAVTIRPETGDALFAHVLASTGDAGALLAGALGQATETGPAVTGGYGVTQGGLCSATVPVRPLEATVSQVTAAGDLRTSPPGRPVVADPATGRNLLARFDQPADVTVHPTLSLAFVAAAGTDNVLVLNTALQDPMEHPLADISVGAAPRAVAVSADGARAYVLNAGDFEVGEIDLQPLFELVADPHAPDYGWNLGQVPVSFLRQQRTARIGEDPLSGPARLGRRLFQHAGDLQISHANRFACASCHTDGGEDKLVWFPPEGPRQTPALAGRLHDTAPYNWNGTEPELGTNMNRTIARLGGVGLGQTELRALAAFLLQGLQAPPNPHRRPTGLTAAQARGKALFERPDVGCAGCHAGPALTDGAPHDVGTASAVERVLRDLRGEEAPIRYDTPSLRGLHATAPYLHDGSAPTLLDVLERTATTMGHTAHLTADQRADLVAWLLTL